MFLCYLEKRIKVFIVIIFIIMIMIMMIITIITCGSGARYSGVM